ncbi:MULTISPECIES: hypothetical protein [Flavobacterium]|uniref:Uncharacterized protein n=1 Tax=Flavobacterium salmonis TaxID=2654844 RepID=A0A6V6Z8R8_9FLAO|nr:MULTISPECIES: hypothetical protein [Flavobacterium]OOV12595.1 hypothetical protein BXU10_24485 [Flavobacterium sp. LM4]OOV19098.1 hypothetical protein BXU10_05345 [Flavobacterium sp. LM4]CAD0008045.1 hypothetical protein FLAT13_04167 [Flavobacterium salmonis]
MINSNISDQEAKARLDFLDIINSFLFEDVPVKIKGEIQYRKRGILTDGEKICLSQERAAIRDFLSYKKGEIDKKQVRNYKVSDKIEDKINTCVIIIKQTNWLKTFKRQYY